VIWGFLWASYTRDSIVLKAAEPPHPDGLGLTQNSMNS